MSAFSQKRTLAVSLRGAGSVDLRTPEYSQFIGDDVAALVSHALGSGFHSSTSFSASATWSGVCAARRRTLSQREKVTGRASHRQIGSTKRGERYADCRIRTGFDVNRRYRYATGNREWSSRESWLNPELRSGYCVRGPTLAVSPTLRRIARCHIVLGAGS